ncbi:methylenetetrahydrofolate reductase [NAD(P)H] [Halomonas sp. McH1-25]|uniref:methylenetetrahydrofolate reductase [NAD(P)H] n=1 Tax=unclassified Halomonas TaxID=2609666 RepID=UPI001EF52578|nr:MULTISPECIES: methylenetetrahydrofolate reductase [NAD(P)H] [unclassified Halomonas]MCG7600001.1 methylenetetrahydrofolate reductase [NAD(P)H] [Halomonas sp. McH1-25]MCP1344065.1 methylenetetrahydrofolate reductase [NAD(P)H] [Halomonas sp. FL8]MCP1360429.1 methylenetetrahydrofolate reductase [NAD(P)H] [Halomonas sp. BBD45]MCP1365946.1 methylenetetrahydrofolate reductase [NAD(P)H] [Halomonas sp. BBD48]
MSAQEHPLGISFEFFPPNTDAGREKLLQARDALAERNPRFFSVTYGAGGSTQARTFNTVKSVRECGINTAPHLSCIGSDKGQMRELLEEYRECGISSLVALRGDLPSGMGGIGELRYANELVEFIRAETGDHFEIAVAAYPEAHPQAPSFEHDLQNFARKIQAGANLAITQYFFSAEAYFHFVERARALGVETPIVPGIMPITNYTKLARFSDACGADIPRWVRKQLEAYGDDSESIQAFGEEVVSNLCRRLLDGGAPGLHFYTLNQAGPTLRVLGNLK